MDSSTKRMYKLGQGTYKVILSFPDIGQSGITYETDALEYDKFSLTESLMNGDSLEFVGCISNILQAQIHGANANLEGEKVIASIDIDGQDDPLQIFVGYVKSSKTRSDLAYKEIVCYDSLWKKVADKDVSRWYNTAQFPMTMKDLRDSFFEYVDIEQEEVELCNDDIVISKEYTQVQRMNALDVAKSICQFNAVCGIMGRDDKFKYVMPESIDSSSDEENFFYKSMRYEEYITNKINKVEVRDDEDAEAIGYGGGANKYIVQGNMFVFGLSTQAKKLVCEHIYNQIKDFQYRPVSYEAPALPFVEVGTTQTFQVLDWLDGNGNRVSRSFPMLSRTLEGIQELTDKVDIQGKRNQTEFITDIRAQLEALQRTTQELKNTSTKIVDYILPADIEESNIASGSNSDIETFGFYNSAEGEKTSFYSMINFTITTNSTDVSFGDCTLTATIRLDGTLLDTIITTYGDGKHSLFLNYLLRDLTHGNHTLKVNFALSGGLLSQMNIVSSYLLAASIVEDGNYDEDYDIDTYDDFAEYAIDMGDEIVGDYLDLSVPDDGGAGNFSGLQFCGEWLSAFIRPMEYFALYKAQYSYPAPAITQDSPLWATYYYENQLLPAYLDNKVYSNSGKHINFWTATISPPNRFLSQDLVAVKMWGAYVGSDIAWKVASNEPTHGFIAFYYDHTGSDITVCDPTDEYFNGYNSQGWDSNFGSHNSLEPTFILVYNVPLFKQYLSTMNFEDMGGFLANHHFALCECNVSKKKR